MKCKRSGFYKIGKSANPKHREKTLQCESPTIEIVAIFNGQGWQETDWHKYFSAQRLRGEWFSLSKTQVAYMCQSLKDSVIVNTEKQKTEIDAIQDRIERICKASSQILHLYSDDEGYAQSVAKIRSKYKIPYGVHLMGECAINDSDIPVFMEFAKLWVNGEMDDEMFELFTFHFCEIVEVDYFWVLMSKPAFYYENTWAQYNGEPTYAEMEGELKLIGTKSHKKRKIGFGLNIGHGFGELTNSKRVKCAAHA